eukprot:2532162-Prymnesium_polylepis.1
MCHGSLPRRCERTTAPRPDSRTCTCGASHRRSGVRPAPSCRCRNEVRKRRERMTDSSGCWPAPGVGAKSVRRQSS